jgi:hypothetical protein
MSTTSRILATTAAALALASVGGGSAAAGGPVTAEPFFSEFTEQDALMTEKCGFPVQATVVSTGIDRFFDPRPGGLGYLGTQRTNITFSANGQTVTFVERGQERAVENSDGTFTFFVIGRFFGDNSVGRLVIDPQTEEIISRSGTLVDYERICAALEG